MSIDFLASPRPSLGVEWECALVDSVSRDLRNVAPELFAAVTRRRGAAGPQTKIHPELLSNTVEVVTGVCRDVKEAMADLQATVAEVRAAAVELGVDVFSAGTHPFASWSEQHLSQGERYEELIERTQWWGRQLLIWGVHVHVGVGRRDAVLPLVSALLTYYPHLQALSASSPMWSGADTGYASNRAMLFQQLPTAGLPYQFSQWAEYEAFVDDQMKTGVLEQLNDLRWDVRPSPGLGTVEVRICDAISTLRELSAVVALTHCLVVDLEQRLQAGEVLPTLPAWFVAENKWRAARYGLDAEIILDAAGNERLVTEDLADLVERLWPVAEGLGCADELAGVADIVSGGASYQRQRAVAAASGGDLVAVVDSVVAELDL